ncbi:MAG TPA: hopanoid biosynthesis-associated protein HpnK [Methylomirabilota bacterium]|nr:hopanoid biosynthesis-associated protein HpnK [Methylomirabilota bacterium]
MKPSVQPGPGRIRLIVNADDFGRSAEINQAVIRAHREGILTSASLMVNEPGFDEAVELAREHPSLAVGLHLTLVLGHSTLAPTDIPDLVNERREFSSAPAWWGWQCFLRRRLRPQMRAEIKAQFEKFHQTGLPLDHVNGHLHFHLHPAVLDLVLEQLRGCAQRCLRLTREPLRGGPALWYRRPLRQIGHALIFRVLAAHARPRLQRAGVRHTNAVYGLRHDGQMDESCLLGLLPTLPPGDFELYSHPSVEPSQELDALISPRVKALVTARGIQLIRYRDL